MQTSKRLLTRSEYRSRIIMAHSRVREAERLMLEGLAAGFPVVEDGNMRSAIVRLEKAAQILREGLARVEDQQEGGAA